MDFLYENSHRWKFSNVKEVVALEMVDQNLVHRGAFEIRASNRFHIQNDLASGQLTLFKIQMPRGKFHRPGMLVEEISPRPLTAAFLQI